MGKLKFTLSNILLGVSLIATCLILENIGFTSHEHISGIGQPIFFMLFALAMGGYLSYFLIEHIKNKVSLDFVLVAILMMCFMGGCLAIWQFSGVSLDGIEHYEYSVTNWDKVIQTLSLITYILAIYSVLFYFNKNHPSIRKIKIVYVIIILVCLFLTIYSWIKEFDAIVFNLSAVDNPKMVQSLFWNPNPFSLFLLLGIFSCFGLNYFKKNVFSYVVMFYLAFFICVVASITGMAIMFASMFIYFLIEICFVIRKNTTKGLILFTIYLVILSSFVVLLACALNYDMGGLSKFLRFLYKNFADANYGDFSKRSITWNCSIDYIGQRPFNLLFGFGYQNSNRIIGGFWYAYYGEVQTSWLSAHSGYIQTLMNFGLVGVITLFLFFVYYLYCFFRLLKKDARFALIYFSIGAALIVYASMESIICLGVGSLGLLIGAFFYVPMMNKWKHYKHPNLGNDVIEVNKIKPMTSVSITKSIAKVFMGLIAVAICMFIFPLFRSEGIGIYFIVNIIVLLFICMMFVPFIISAISKRHSRKVASILCSINFLVVSAPIVYLGVRYYFHSDWFASGAEWLFPVFIIIILVGETFIFGVAKSMKFKDYVSTYVGASKNSFMGLLGAGAIALVGYFVLNYLDLSSPLTYAIYPVSVLLAFYLASYLVPFKDQKQFIYEYNESLMYSMKMEVLKDRLGDYNEKRRD